MPRLVAFLTATVLVAALVPEASALAPAVTNGSVYAEVTDTEVVLGNALVERRWQRAGFQTLAMIDKRGGPVSADGAPDFRLTVGGAPAEITSDLFDVTSVEVTEIDGGLRVTMELAGPGINATRIAEAYDGIAGFKTQTILEPLTPLALRGYTLDEAAVGNEVAATIHAFRAGADWREPDWGGPDLAVGDGHPGTWRDSRSASAGENLQGPAEWITAQKSGHSLFMVMERNDWPSSRAACTSGGVRLVVDYSADLVITGPFEEQIHAENPRAGETPGRQRVFPPLATLRLENAFTGFGANPDDEPWQFYKYLSLHRLDSYDHTVTFNSNGTDDNVHSTGAKDDMTEEVVAAVAPKARRLGIETFILDDGWQARSGDWQPDCGTTPGEPNTDPRWDGTEATAQFAPRFSDCTFEKVRELIAPMKLGLWMNAMHFHPRSSAYTGHPQWACKPSGDATGALSLVDPDGGSNEAGIGTWGPDAIPHVESRIREAIESWGVTYFKFDFLVWLDCVGQDDFYGYKERFIAMLDRLHTDHPNVIFQIDETNDYRLFPFDSVARGPSWFQNGSPEPSQLLHNIWNLSPYIPAYSLGQHFLGDIGDDASLESIDLRMAVALPSHLTFFSDLRKAKYTDAVLDRARAWIDFYEANRELFSSLTYPLLDDPINGGWTALQTWDPEQGRGALLAFRQQSDDQTKSVALRNVPPGMTFDLFAGPSGDKVGTVTSQQLSDGIEITLPADGARVLLIEPAEIPEFDPTTTLTYDGTTQVKVGKELSLAATLVGSDGPIPGVTISFAFRGQTYPATTGAGGRGEVVGLKQPGPPGVYEVVVSYAGSGSYNPSQTTTSILVSH